MTPFDVLGLPAHADSRAIKRAYSQLLKLHHPDDDPEGFARIHGAYRSALRIASARELESADELARHHLRDSDQTALDSSGSGGVPVDDEVDRALLAEPAAWPWQFDPDSRPIRPAAPPGVPDRGRSPANTLRPSPGGSPDGSLIAEEIAGELLSLATAECRQDEVLQGRLDTDSRLDPIAIRSRVGELLLQRLVDEHLDRGSELRVFIDFFGWRELAELAETSRRTADPRFSRARRLVAMESALSHFQEVMATRPRLGRAIGRLRRPNTPFERWWFAISTDRGSVDRVLIRMRAHGSWVLDRLFDPETLQFYLSFDDPRKGFVRRLLRRLIRSLAFGAIAGIFWSAVLLVAGLRQPQFVLGAGAVGIALGLIAVAAGTARDALATAKQVLGWRIRRGLQQLRYRARPWRRLLRPWSLLAGSAMTSVLALFFEGARLWLLLIAATLAFRAVARSRQGSKWLLLPGVGIGLMVFVLVAGYTEEILGSRGFVFGLIACQVHSAIWLASEAAVYRARALREWKASGFVLLLLLLVAGYVLVRPVATWYEHEMKKRAPRPPPEPANQRRPRASAHRRDFASGRNVSRVRLSFWVQEPSQCPRFRGNPSRRSSVQLCSLLERDASRPP